MTVFSIHMIFGPFYFHLEFGTHRQIISHSFQKAEMLSVRKSGGESSLCLGLTCGSPEPGAVAVYDGVKGSGLEVEHLDVGPGLADGECQNIDILIEKDWPGHNNWTRQYKTKKLACWRDDDIRGKSSCVQCFVLDLVRLDGEQQSVPVHCESLHNVTFIIVLIIMTTLISDTW